MLQVRCPRGGRGITFPTGRARASDCDCLSGDLARWWRPYVKLWPVWTVDECACRASISLADFARGASQSRSRAAKERFAGVVLTQSFRVRWRRHRQWPATGFLEINKAEKHEKTERPPPPKTDFPKLRSRVRIPSPAPDFKFKFNTNVRVWAPSESSEIVLWAIPRQSRR